MTETQIFYPLLYVWIALAVVVFALLLVVSAPYGRHTRRGWGPQINRTLGWILMEAPAPLWFAALFVLGDRQGSSVAWVFFLMWEIHYVQRGLIFPFQLRGGTARMPLLIALFALTFNLVNGYLNARYLFHLGPSYPPQWLVDPRFIGGALLFVAGYAINRHADALLIRLRDRDEPGYKIPYGGLYRFISCPNYFGEVVEWSGWALATWSLPGLAFALWTVANLVPRARSHHRWYHETFPDYPRGRQAVIPFLY